MRNAYSSAIVVLLSISSPAWAQEPSTSQPVTPPVWSWVIDGNVFFGHNYQQRHFADFSSWESQNWFMMNGERQMRKGRVLVGAMVSLEPFTLHRQGSPQLFQTGESYRGTPLLNYQHPHDLVMGLGAIYQTTGSTISYIVGADLVGSPTLGPTPFMHRLSARDNPQVPLTHHFLDSTHVTTGVVRGGIAVAAFTVEASAFRGAEPNENRLDLERPRLDSWAARVRYDRGPWHAQFSAGHLREPEWFEPYDVTRVTATIAFDGTIGSRPLNLTMAWGGNREFNGFNGNADGYLVEIDAMASERSTFYGRAEVADKDLFGLSPHPKGQSHRHVFYKIGAETVGYLFDLWDWQRGRLGIGADVTFYQMPRDLLQYWESSHSYHVFLRWRAPAIGGTHHH